MSNHDKRLRRIALHRRSRPARQWGRWALAPLLVWASLAASTPAYGQMGSAAGRPVTVVETEGLEQLSEETLLYYLGLEPGTPLDPQAIDARIKELWQRRLIDDIQIDAFPDGSGARVVVRIVERPLLRSVEYVGLKRLSRTDIDDRKARERIVLAEGTPLDRGELERLRALIEEMYREKGYRFALVNLSFEELDRNELRATFTVDESEKVRIGDIDFEGNEVFGDLRLRWIMKDTKESGVITRILKKDIYNPATLEEDLVKVRDLYRSVGYKNVLVGEPTIDVKTDGDKRRLVLTVPIEEGERWRFGDLSIEGNERFTAEVLKSLFEYRQGGWLRTDDIDEAVENIEQAYNNSGYIFSQVQTELVERDDYVADLVVRISENEQFKVSRIEFEGNTGTRDKVLRRELRVQEGFVVNLGGVRNSIFKINQLGFFKLDENEPVEFDPDTEAKTVNLTFKGGEDNRTELQFGAGYSDFQGFFGQVSFRTHNFLGRGETLGASVESGRQQDTFDISYFIPWFLDRPQSVGAQLFQQRVNFRLGGDTLLRESTGAVLTYGRSFRLFQSVSISYTLSRFEDEVRSIIDGEEVVLRRLDIDNSSIRPAWVYNAIDSRFEPTRGLRLRASTEYAGGFLGGDNFFLRPEIGATYFKPISAYPLRTVLGLNVEAGWIEPFGTFINSAGERVDRGLSPLERYFLGGENSVRGHRFRSIFVRDDQGNPVQDTSFGTFGFGGDKYFQVNLEYHFLLGGPFRIIAYVDGGNVFGDFTGDDGEPIKQGIDVSDLRWTTGLELRLMVPVFGAPLRFIYASNLDPQVNDEFDTFRFSIGASF